MPKKRPGPITISSPIPRSPDGLLTPNSAHRNYPSPSTRGASSPRTPTKNTRGGKNQAKVYDEVSLIWFLTADEFISKDL
ncbi:uncharacterized protein I206_107294 [Kwoniella pini CBS 10737]|uniref:Uncharacterized protein n=1 Tax=Kwoniella pini CBS 10737 TaxID=1296096 RepID=A0A1B9HYM7_9TREE|nr:uncharacterized protein I206_05162 [Kwoniella pini CBS 10737]OCF48385.1 hypothetical protein I206_05162 [Kwoniella pini CBS 10737]